MITKQGTTKDRKSSLSNSMSSTWWDLCVT